MALRNAFEGLAENATLLAVRDLLAGTLKVSKNANPNDFTNPIHTANQTRLEWAALNARSFFAGGSVTSGSLGSSSLRASVYNPAGSGRNVRVHTALMSCTSALTLRMMVNPTAGLPTAAPRPNNNTYIGHPNTSLVEVRIDTGAEPTGGTSSGTDLALPEAGEKDMIRDAFITVPPGVTVVVYGTVPASATATLFATWEDWPA